MKTAARSLFGSLAVCAALLALTRSGAAGETKVAIKDVPALVKTAALKSVKNGMLVEVEKRTRGKSTLYELEIKAGGKEYEVVVTPEGKVLKIEAEDEADDDEEEADGRTRKTAGGKDKTGQPSATKTTDGAVNNKDTPKKAEAADKTAKPEKCAKTEKAAKARDDNEDDEDDDD